MKSYKQHIIDDLLKLKDDKGEMLGQVLSLDSIDYTAFDTWEWPQGVALFGLSQIYKNSKDEKIIEILTKWFEKNYDSSTPKNINTFAPMHCLVTLYDVTRDEKYKVIIEEWKNWAINEMPKTAENGFQHSVSERDNDGELWDDTLMMTVLPLLRYAKITNDVELIEMSKYQFYLHAKYLFDTKTGLWFHGWNFNGRHNFCEALWCRGNSWITVVTPHFIELCIDDKVFVEFASNIINNQLEALDKYWDNSGLWHTLLDDESSYLEMSGSLGIAAGILHAKRLGVSTIFNKGKIDKLYDKLVNDLETKGIIDDVSYGTPMGHDLQFYRDIPITPMPYGHSLALLFLIEMELNE